MASRWLPELMPLTPVAGSACSSVATATRSRWTTSSFRRRNAALGGSASRSVEPELEEVPHAGILEPQPPGRHAAGVEGGGEVEPRGGTRAVLEPDRVRLRRARGRRRAAPRGDGRAGRLD